MCLPCLVPHMWQQMKQYSHLYPTRGRNTLRFSDTLDHRSQNRTGTLSLNLVRYDHTWLVPASDQNLRRTRLCSPKSGRTLRLSTVNQEFNFTLASIWMILCSGTQGTHTLRSGLCLELIVPGCPNPQHKRVAKLHPSPGEIICTILFTNFS